MKIKTIFFCCIILTKCAAFAQSKAYQYAISALNKTANTKVFSYQFTAYFKSIGETTLPAPWEGTAYVAPDSFVCNYKSWGGHLVDYYSLCNKYGASRYYINTKEKQYELNLTEHEAATPHSGFNVYSPMAKRNQAINYLTA